MTNQVYLVKRSEDHAVLAVCATRVIAEHFIQMQVAKNVVSFPPDYYVTVTDYYSHIGDI